MHKKWVWTALLAVPLAVVGGLVYAKSLTQAEKDRQQVQAAGYTCPLTGEELPCPNCCPLNQQK
jgi:hypothetical protein